MTLIKSPLVLGLRPRSEFKIAFSISGIKFLSHGDITIDLPYSMLILDV